MANDVSVRQYLQGQGVNNSDIGYDQNSGNVTVRGQNFIRPATNLAGTTYDSQQNLDSAYGNYAKTLPTIQPNGTTTTGSTGQTQNTANANVAPTATTSPTQSTQYTNPYTQQIADLMKHLSDSSSAQPADIYSSPQYAAAQAAQQRTSGQAIRQANEQAAGAGLGHSTIMTDRSQKIQDDSNNYLQTQLVPQIQAQLQAQRQQELANQQNQLHDYMTLGQQADTQHQNELNNQFKQADITGVYNPSGQTAQQVQAQMDKNSAAYAAASPAEKDRLHSENMQLAGLLGKTYDSGTGTYSEGQGFAGTQTLAGKTLDLNNAKDMAVLTGKMPDGTLTNAAQQQALTNEWTASEKLGVVTPALAQLYGLPAGTKTEAAKEHAQNLAISQQSANASSLNASTSASNSAWAQDPNNPDNKYKNAEIDALNNKPVKYATAEDFAKYVETTPLISNIGGIKTVTDPVALEKAILSSGMTPQEMTKAYNAYKIPLKKQP